MTIFKITLGKMEISSKVKADNPLWAGSSDLYFLNMLMLYTPLLLANNKLFKLNTLALNECSTITLLLLS